ncbi:MAG: histidine triad nucleotide-binding protein [Leptospiraceae bacterium]|nr:histidine triad nucleotide-binding protein [Leptospiraceae bacterium]MCB1199183.1 histidine triad nucleotide-binding protein [Leptospiraceae bacterium]
MADCLFCKIIAREIPAEIIAEGDDYLAFKDIHPQAPVHFLVIPKLHIQSLAHVADPETLLATMGAIVEVAREQGLDENGYRVVNNVGKYGGQTVNHIHFHVLSGRRLTWPPG